MQWPISCQGREVAQAQVEGLREWIARSFLQKLAERQLLTLPSVRAQYRLGRRERILPRQEAPPVISTLAALQPLELVVVEPGSVLGQRWASATGQ